MTLNEIASIAFDAVRKKITYIPDWFRGFILQFVQLFLLQKVYGPIEFFLTVMAMNMIAPEHGKNTLHYFFKGLAKSL